MSRHSYIHGAYFSSYIIIVLSHPFLIQFCAAIYIYFFIILSWWDFLLSSIHIYLQYIFYVPILD
jgi:hypothetical protein